MVLKKNKIAELTLPNIKLYYEVIVIETLVKDESPEVHTHKYG